MAESPTQQPQSQLSSSPLSNVEIHIERSDDTRTRLLLNFVLDGSLPISLVIPLSRSDDLHIEMMVSYIIGYLENPEAYEDEAELDDGGNRGTPPATESAIAALENMKTESENEAVRCVVCLDMVNVGETAKKLPCGHGYHGDCIVHWLGKRNTCPACRFELPTNDADYEEKERNKICSGGASGFSSAGNLLPRIVLNLFRILQFFSVLPFCF